MDEKDDPKAPVGTCFEGPRCAEMMQKIVGEQGIGSLCEERLRSLMKRCSAASSRENGPDRDREGNPGGTK